MMTSVPTLHAGNFTWPHGTDKGEEALDYMEGLSASSVLPPESFLDLQSTRGPAAVSHPFPEGGWVVGVGVEQAWLDILLLVLKGLVMSAVIVASVLGNLLVIVSVARYHKLRVITNYFVVSMALADMLVALMAMVFNASVQLTHTWLFGQLMCDLWNSMDVYFSTVSILHLCCISIDRYTAIVQPLDYPLRMTVRTVSLMLAVAWLSPVFISVVPIFLGWYTTQEHLDRLASTPGLCEFRVNVAYAVVSSSVSFWIPGVIMLVMYFKIYREADRQEMMVFRSTVAALLLNKHLHINGMTRSSVKITDDAPSTTSAAGGGAPRTRRRRQARRMGEAVGSGVHHNGMPAFESACPGSLEQQPPPPPSVVARVDLPQSDESTPTPTPSPGSTPISRRGRAGVKRRFLGVGVRKSSTGVGPDGIVNVSAPEVKKKQASLHKMKRERKAAKTLGIIVSVFLLCWLPFFSWYIVSALCGDACAVPEWLVTVLFWIGYFNSTLNPIIYAYFNRDFRKAFRKTLSHYGLDCAVCRRCIPRIRCCGKGCRRKGLARCVGFGAGQDTPSSEIQPRSALSSEYCHIEMTTIDKVAKIGVDH